MNIGIDIRCLQDQERTGVGEYTFGLLRALFVSHPEHRYLLFTSGFQKPTLPASLINQPHVQAVHVRVPNKVLSASLLATGRPYIDALLLHEAQKKSADAPKKLDAFFSPNIGLTAVSPNVKHIVTVHDLSYVHFANCYSVKRRLWHKAARPERILHSATSIMVPSAFTKSDIMQTYAISEDKIHISRPGLPELLVPKERRDVREIYALPDRFMLFLGTIEPRKNILGLVHAFARSEKLKKAGVALVIAGAAGWKNKDIFSAIEQTPRVSYIGYVDARDKRGLYKAAEAFVYPSLYEGFGFPVLEALSCGTPILTSARTSLPEVAGQHATYVNPMSIGDMQRGLEAVLETEQQQREIKKQYAAQFTWNDAVQQLITAVS